MSRFASTGNCRWKSSFLDSNPRTLQNLMLVARALERRGYEGFAARCPDRGRGHELAASRMRGRYRRFDEESRDGTAAFCAESAVVSAAVRLLRPPGGRSGGRGRRPIRDESSG